MIAQNKTFKGRQVSLDGSAFDGCTFDKCHLVFSGYIPVSLENCNFNDCTWEFTGPATNTIVFMKALHAAGATDLIENTCREICGQALGTGPTLH